MNAIANAFKRAAGVAETDIKNEIPTPYYGRKVVADAVTSKLKSKAKPEPAQKQPEYVTMTNYHGYSDFGYFEDGKFHVICASCHALKLMNTGFGTACDKCNTDTLNEMAHDYRT